jgi:hypothetical protein
MIVIPERVAYIKVPKAASTTIARLFWERHGIDQFATVNADTASTLRHFLGLDQIAQRIPVLNGNWFYNRSQAFGWHSAYRDLMHVFGEQLADFHWVASVRHPVSRLFSVFSYQVGKGRLAATLCAADFEAFCDLVFEDSTKLSIQQRVHTWPQVQWLPQSDEVMELSIVRQEQLAPDLARLAARVPTFAAARLRHINKSFDGSLQPYVSAALTQQIEDHYAEDMARLGY